MIKNKLREEKIEEISWETFHLLAAYSQELPTPYVLRGSKVLDRKTGKVVYIINSYKNL